jgi:hypothetical protein
MASVSTTNSNALFKFKAFSLLAALLLNIFLVGCGGGGSSDDDASNAQKPTITVHPQSANYTKGEVADNLSVSAVSKDGGVLSYQWYKNNANFNSNGTALPNETNETFAPPTSDTGIVYYYVVVTNTNDKVNGEKKAAIASDTAQIAVDTKTYSVSFYDANLDFMEAVLVKEGAIDNVSTIKSGSWYKANESVKLTNHNLNESVNFYALPNVQEITTQTQLAAINTNDVTLNGTYILLSDINLTSGEAGFDATEGWTPIGNDNTNHFRGIFNGNGNKITNLWINTPSTPNVGFFGTIENAQIKNLGVETDEGKEIKGYYVVGGIVGGVINGSIANSYSTGNISGDNQIGGIVGYAEYSNITNSYSNGSISGNSGIIGGIAGYTGSSNITNSYSTGDISGGDGIGGIAGGVISGSIANSYSTGNISGGDSIGGIAGGISAGTIQNNAAINPSVTGTSNVSRVIGYVETTYGPNTISNNFALNTMSGGISGSFDSSDINRYGTSKTDVELKTQTTYSWDFTNVWEIPSSGGYPILRWQK